MRYAGRVWAWREKAVAQSAAGALEFNGISLRPLDLRDLKDFSDLKDLSDFRALKDLRDLIPLETLAALATLEPIGSGALEVPPRAYLPLGGLA